MHVTFLVIYVHVVTMQAGENEPDENASAETAKQHLLGIDKLAQLLPPIASPSGQDLAALMTAVTPLETSVSFLIQQLHQVQLSKSAFVCRSQASRMIRSLA